MGNPFIDDTIPQQAPVDKDNPFMSLGGEKDTTDNPFMQLGGGYERPPNLAERLIQGMIVEPMKDVSTWIKVSMTGPTVARQALIGGRSATFAAETQPGALAPRTAQEAEDYKRAARGAALAASFLGSPAVEATGVGPLLGKWGSFLVGESLGGGLYGAFRPTGEDESRAHAILGDALIFAAFGGTIRGASEITSWALKRYIMAMPDAKQQIALGMAKAARDRVESDLSHGGVTFDQLPAEAAAKIEEPILREAVHAAEPGEINIDEIVRREADRQVEMNTRMEKAGPEITGLTPPPEMKFEEALAKAKMTRIPGTKKGFEVTGERVTPKVPTEPTVTEILEGKAKKPENITGVAVKGKSGKVYPAATGETTHPQIMSRLFEGGTPESEFIDESGRYSHAEVAGYSTTKREFVSKEQAVREGLEGATARAKEYIISPVVKGKSGKLYVGGSTHPEIMDRNIAAGVPKEEFDVPDKNRGFKTNVHEFTSRDYASGLVGHPEPLVSEDVHKRGLLPTESTPVAELNMENVAKQIADPNVSASVKETALMDAATDHAVSEMKPAATSTPAVKAEIQEIHTLPPKRSAKASEKLQQILTDALNREGPAADKGVLLELTSPSPEQVLMEREKAGTPHEQNRDRVRLEGLLGKEKALIEFEPSELVASPEKEPALEERMTVPKKLNGIQIAVRLKDEELETLRKRLISGEAGRVSGRLLLLGIGSYMEWLGWGDNNLDDSWKTGLKWLGGFMIGASLGPRLAEAFQKSQRVRRTLTAYNPELMMNAYPKGKEFTRQFVELLTESKARAKIEGDALDKIFTDESSNRAAMFAIEDDNAPEWNNLTAAQKTEAMALRQVNLRMGILGKAEGILDEYKENYIRHLLPPESFQRWKTTGFKVLPTSGAFAKERKFSLRELEDWAKQQGVPGPIMKVSTVHAYHMAEFDRALAGTRLRAALEKVDLVKDAPKNAMTPMPEGWRPIGVLNMQGKIAPEPIAKALENISSPRASSAEIINDLDRVKSLWMRGIMFWFWEHGWNAMRSLINLSMNPLDYANTLKFMKETEGLELQGARHGLNLYERPDYGIDAHRQAEITLGKIGLGRVGARVDKFLGMQDRLLWDKLIPALQKFTYAMEMHKWTERTGGKFLEGSPEFTTAARKAADFANTVAGRVPRVLQDPALARGMRLLMFSPQWTTSRITLMANAFGELGQIFDGTLNPKDATYLHFKMRQLAWGIMITAGLSKLISNNWPVFNPSTSKFYMRTGLHNADGKEIGLDVIGWWQDDLRLFNHPFDYMMARVNPSLKLAQETLSGRDYLGRQMTPGQRIGNIFASFGPPTEAIADAARVGQALAGGRPISGGEAITMASRASGMFRTAAIPRPMDVTIAKYAKKLLIGQGIPANDDNIFDLSRLMRANLISGRDMVDERVVTLLAYRRRGETIKHPFSTMLWQETRRAIADF